MKVKSEREVTESCPTLRDPIDRSPPGSSVHGIFQARVLERGAIAFSDGTCEEVDLLLVLFSLCLLSSNLLICQNGDRTRNQFPQHWKFQTDREWLGMGGEMEGGEEEGREGGREKKAGREEGREGGGKEGRKGLS